MASSTGRNTAVPSGSTIPWTLHGTPSRNGITRTRSQRAAKKASAMATSSSETTQRTKSPPPLNPSRASPAQTVPAPWSSRPAARVASSTGTTRDSARSPPTASQTASATSLSSSAVHAAGRPPTTRRPSMGSVPMNGPTSQSASRSGS